jgi:hypothetical protein
VRRARAARRPKAVLKACTAGLYMIAAIAACAGAAEQPVVEKFFAASRLHDRTALADVATVSIDPIVDGAVTDFKILHIDREQTNEMVTVDATMHLANGTFARRRVVLTLKRQDGKLMVTGVMLGRDTLPL